MSQKPFFLNLFFNVKVSLERVAFLFSKNKIFLFFILLNLFQNGSTAQVKQLDSLKALLVIYNDGDEKELELLNQIVLFQVNNNPNDALVTADKAILLAQTLNNKKQLALAYNNKGFVLLRKSQFDEATDYLQKSISIYSSLKHQTGIANSQIQLAEILRRKGETDNSKILVEKALRIYEQTNNLKGKADAYFYLALINRDLSDFKKLLELCNKAIEIYARLNNNTQLELAIDAKAGAYYYLSDYVNALKYAGEAKQLSERRGNQYGLAMSHASLGHIYSELPDFPKAVDNHLKALKIHEAMGNLQLQGNMNVNIGLDYFELKKYSLALDYTEKGIKQMDSLEINNGQYRVAVVYMGMIYLELRDIKKSLEHTNRAIRLCLAANDEWALSDAYHCLGNNCLFLHQYYAAYNNIKKALSLSIKLESPVNSDEYYVSMGKALTYASEDELMQAGILPKNRYQQAVDYFEKAIKIGRETNTRLATRDAYEQLSVLYERKGDTEKSLNYYKQFIAHKDSIDNADNVNAIALLQIQYETEKKEKQITLLTKESHLQQTELQKQNTTRNVLIAAFALAALLAGAIFNRYRIKKNANAEIEKTMEHLKNTQEKLIEQEKVASLGELTADVARKIEVPITKINQLNKHNRTFINKIKNSDTFPESAIIEVLKSNLQHIYQNGKDADGMVKKVLTQTRKLQE